MPISESVSWMANRMTATRTKSASVTLTTARRLPGRARAASELTCWAPSGGGLAGASSIVLAKGMASVS